MAKEKDHFALKNFLSTKIGNKTHYHYEHPKDNSFKWEGTAWDKREARSKAQDAYEEHIHSKKKVNESHAAAAYMYGRRAVELAREEGERKHKEHEKWKEEQAKKEKEKLKEEIANAVGGGAIAGLGVGPQGEPGRKRGKFAGHETFIVKRNTFLSLREAKRKGKHWRTYLEEDDAYAELREYARKNKGPIVVECEATGACMFVRYGNGGLHSV